MTFKREYQTALRAVGQASRLCGRLQQNLLKQDTVIKSDESPVTVADFASQAIITANLLQSFPHIPIIAEEDSITLRAPENSELLQTVSRLVKESELEADTGDVLDWLDAKAPTNTTDTFWTIDPIDGTRGFVAGRQYAIALALIHQGEVVLGVLGCPALKDKGGTPGLVFGTFAGHDAREYPLFSSDEGSPIRVRTTTSLSDAIFCESVETGHSNHDASKEIAEKLGISAPPFRIDSQCKYAAVARGDASIYLRLPTRKDYREKIWDHAAGVAIVTAAGGKVTDVDGRPLDFTKGATLRDNRGVVATSGAIHDAVIDAVVSTLPPAEHL